MYDQTLEYWDNRNKSNHYSKKIMKEVSLVETEISNNPFFLSKYIEHIGLYKKVFFKGKFVLFYEIQGDTIFIEHFRSTRQKPL